MITMPPTGTFLSLRSILSNGRGLSIAVDFVSISIDVMKKNQYNG